MSLIVCNVPVVVSATFNARRKELTPPSNDRLAVSTFLMKFASRNSNNRSRATTDLRSVDVTTVTEVSVSPKPERWTFMDETDDRPFDEREVKSHLDLV